MVIENLISQFEPLTLDELDGMELLKRFDTKYVISKNDIPGLIKGLENEYRILEIDKKRIFTYESLYLDTDDHYFYKTHHNQKLNRYKVRFRNYAESNKKYLEIKFKTNKEKLKKYRKKQKSQESIEEKISPELLEFIGEKIDRVDPEKLSPKIWVNYRRFSLASKSQAEKMTIDTDITFETIDGSKKLKLNSVVVEVKQGNRSVRSPIITKLKREFGISPISFSKYCMGMVLLNLESKYNRFKPRLLTLERMK